MGTVEKVTPVPAQGTPQQPQEPTVPARRAWNPFEDMDRMMERMRERHFGRGLFEPLRFEWPFHETPMPRVDVADRDAEVMVRAEVPGVAKEDLEITMSGNTITFRGTTKHKEEKEEGEYRYCETSCGEFSRTLTLPADVDSSNAKAKYKDGMVELVLPKLEIAQRKKVDVEEE